MNDRGAVQHFESAAANTQSARAETPQISKDDEILAGSVPVVSDGEYHLVISDEILDKLSRRQKVCLGHILGGLSREQIAKEMNIKPFTLLDYVKAIYTRLGVHSEEELLSEVYGQPDAESLKIFSEKHGLTEKQYEALYFTLKGDTHKNAAGHLFLTPDRFAQRLKAVREKMGIETNTPKLFHFVHAALHQIKQERAAAQNTAVIAAPAATEDNLETPAL